MIEAGRLRRWLLVTLVVWATSGCQALFPTEAGDDLAHFESRAPATGAPAPDLELVDLEGQPVRLDAFVGEQPVVLMLGSHSCPVYRYRRHDIDALEHDFAGRVSFVTVYTLEAHPSGSNSPYRDEEWLTPINRLTGVRLNQPGVLAERIRRARDSTLELERPGTVLVDAMDNRAWSAYGEAPAPAFVIDTEGTIALRQVWFEPDAIRSTLEDLLSR